LAKPSFFGQKLAAKNEKKYLLNAKQRNSFHPARWSAPNLGFFVNNYWGG